MAWQNLLANLEVKLISSSREPTAETSQGSICGKVWLAILTTLSSSQLSTPWHFDPFAH